MVGFSGVQLRSVQRQGGPRLPFEYKNASRCCTDCTGSSKKVGVEVLSDRSIFGKIKIQVLQGEINSVGANLSQWPGRYVNSNGQLLFL